MKATVVPRVSLDTVWITVRYGYCPTTPVTGYALITVYAGTVRCVAKVLGTGGTGDKNQCLACTNLMHIRFCHVVRFHQLSDGEDEDEKCHSQKVPSCHGQASSMIERLTHYCHIPWGLREVQHCTDQKLEEGHCGICMQSHRDLSSFITCSTTPYERLTSSQSFVLQRKSVLCCICQYGICMVTPISYKHINIGTHCQSFCLGAVSNEKRFLCRYVGMSRLETNS